MEAASVQGREDFGRSSEQYDIKTAKNSLLTGFLLDDLVILNMTQLIQLSLIPQLFRCRTGDAEERQALVAEACQVAMASAKLNYIIQELMHFLTQQCLVAPGDSFMQDTVGQALTPEQDRLSAILSQHLSAFDVTNLNRLVEDSPEYAFAAVTTREWASSIVQMLIG